VIVERRVISMDKAQGWRRLLNHFVATVKGLVARLSPKPQPAMIGIPPSARRILAIPADPAEHAKDFADRYYEPLEAIVRKRMREVGVPEDRIGMLDVDNGFRLAAFHTKRLEGGGVHPPTGRINLDAGLFKPGLLVETMPLEVSLLYDKSRASVRQDVIIAHEYEEGVRGSHEAAVEHAPDTKLAIKEEARRLLRAQRERRL
jgi:hypothetical protein